jgi:hypothetical protein
MGDRAGGGYPLGSDEDELARLDLQGRALAPGTRAIFAAAGIRPGGPFDVIVERLALMYVPDPAEVLRRQATGLRAGGLVVPIESGFATARVLPATPLASQAVSWLIEAFPKSGIHSLGPRLWSVLLQAGLQPLGMMGLQPHFGPGDPDGAGLLAGIIRTAVPVMERTGVATAEEIGVETLAQRLADELQMNAAVFAYPILLSAWATTGLL